MSKVEYSPPLEVNQVVSKSEGPDGLVNSITLMLKDANRNFFTLHIATGSSYVASENEFNCLDTSNLEEPPEPVFVIQNYNITGKDIDNILNDIGPSILGSYLVKQEN